MRKILIILVLSFAGCSFPFTYEYVSPTIELPSLSAIGGYHTMPVDIPADVGIPFDDIEFKEVLVRIEGINNSEVDSNAELNLTDKTGNETLFNKLIPAGGSAAVNSVSKLLADGLNKQQFKFTIQAKNDQGDIHWEDYWDDPRIQDLITKYHGINSVDDLINNPEALDDAMSVIDMKISVKISLIFKGVYKLNIGNLIEQVKGVQ